MAPVFNLNRYMQLFLLLMYEEKTLQFIFQLLDVLHTNWSDRKVKCSANESLRVQFWDEATTPVSVSVVVSGSSSTVSFTSTTIY